MRQTNTPRPKRKKSHKEKKEIEIFNGEKSAPEALKNRIEFVSAMVGTTRTEVADEGDKNKQQIL